MESKSGKLNRWLQFWHNRLLQLTLPTGLKTRNCCKKPQAEIAPLAHETAEPEQESGDLFILWDAIGDGRVIGVFENAELAEEIRLINPYYYRYYRCKLNSPTDYGLEWLDEKQRWKLQCLLLKYGKKHVTPK